VPAALTISPFIQRSSLSRSSLMRCATARGGATLCSTRSWERGYGLELDPLYVDAAVRRWQAFTKRDAILRATDQTFDEVALARSSKQTRRAK
jgi:hypothetical protein